MGLELNRIGGTHRDKQPFRSVGNFRSALPPAYSAGERNPGKKKENMQTPDRASMSAGEFKAGVFSLCGSIANTVPPCSPQIYLQDDVTDPAEPRQYISLVLISNCRNAAKPVAC